MRSRDQVDDFVERAVGIFPRLDPEVEGVVDRLAHLDKRFGQLLEHTVAPFGLNKGEFKVLTALRQRPPGYAMSPGALGECFLLSSGAMTNRLDRLEEAGLVKRVRDVGDRRLVQVELTPKGTRHYERSVETQAAKEAIVAAALGAREQAQLNDLLRKLMREFERREKAR